VLTRTLNRIGPGIGGKADIPVISRFFGVSDQHYAEFEGLFAEAKASEDSSWLAYGKAFEELDTNWISKMIVEMIADPTTYLGFGVAKIFKPIPYLGTATLMMEKGWVRAWDLPFIALQKGIGATIPRIAFQAVEKDAFRHVQVVMDYLNSSFPRAVPAAQMGMTRIKENLQIAQKVLWNNPHHSGTLTDAVRGLLQRPTLHPDEATGIASRLNVSISPEDLHQKTSELDAILSHSRGLPGGMSHDPAESADLILNTLGADHTAANIQTAGNIITRTRQQALTRFDSIINQPTFKDFVNAVIDHRKFVLRANQINPISEYRNRTAMLMASMSSGNRLSPALTTIAATFDLLNRFSYAFTRMYLMSSFYGPFNILETALKSAIMSINPFFRGKPILELQRNAMGFETLMPRIFVTGETFQPQAQDIATAGATDRASTTGSRNAYKRIWLTKQNILRKMYATADEFFIQAGARVGLDQAAHVLNVLSQRHLFESPATGRVARRVLDMTSQHTESLKGHMSPKVLEMHRQEMFRRAIQDPNSLSNMAAEFVDGYVHAAQIQEIVSKYPTIDPAIREYLTDISISGPRGIPRSHT